MRPLSSDELEDLGLREPANPAVQAREKEIRDFWLSGEEAAELPKFSTLSIETEKQKYMRAIRKVGRELHIDWTRDVIIRVRKGRIVIIRKTPVLSEEIQHVGYDDAQLGREK